VLGGRGLTPADCLAIEREACKRSLATFVQEAWHVIEPAQPYVHGWHIDAVAEHLEAVTAGQINRLYVNVPPGTMKSLLVSVFWPAWEWGPLGLPATRYVATSHSERLAVRDNLRCRRLIESEWFQTRWPIVFTSDQNAKTKFENKATGFREAMPFTSLTGSRGDRVLIDDPLSVDDAASEAKREAVNTTFLEAVPTRLNNPDRSAIVVIMQRLHERDVVGVIEARGLGYESLVLPMEFEADRRCRTAIGFSDPRAVDGELLFPERFPPAVVERDRKAMGSYAWAGQMQQRPAPRDGGMFKRAWFGVVDAAPASSRKVRRWDFAATDSSGAGDPDWTVGLLLSETGGVYYIEGVVRDRVSPAGVERMLKSTAEQDGKAVKVRIPQDPGAAGKSTAAHQIRLLAGWDIRSAPETGSKEVRAIPVSAQAEAGNIKLVRGPWNESFLDEICVFPNGAHDDQVDALSGAFAELLKATKPPTVHVGTYGRP
jgi:predicted phage terminase large subunit-like protein